MKKLLSIGVVIFVMAAFSSALASDYCATQNLGEEFCITTKVAQKMLVADQENVEPTVFLLDVRTPEEWKWVGYPGKNKMGEGEELDGRVVKIDWKDPDNFMPAVKAEFGNMPADTTIITMCRSGKRSYYAAQALIDAGYTAYSMSDGFEGDKNEEGYRLVNGWKNANKKYPKRWHKRYSHKKLHYAYTY